MATFYSYDDVYKIYAYRENHIRIVATQGEGATQPISLTATDSIKSPRFQLRDERGIITIPSSGNPRVHLAVTRPDNTEDLLDCVVEDREKSIVSCPIRKSLTDITGDVKGEIRLITANAITKFYGINFFIYDGVSDAAAAQSTQFSELIRALQQVNAIITGGSEGTISLDTVIQHNGTKPVASGIIYDYLQGNYHQISFAHESNAASYSDGGVYIDNATDIMKMYYVLNSNNAKVAILFNVCTPGYSYATQVKIDAWGNITTRVKTQESGESDYTWKNWTPVGTTKNIQDSAVTTAKIADGTVTSAKIGNGEVKTSNINNSAVTTAKVADSSITPVKLDRTYTEFVYCSNDEIDTANNCQCIYRHIVSGYFRGLVFFTGYNNYASATTVRQYRLCMNGRFEYRNGTVVTPYTVPNTYTWDKAYNENWTPIGSTANIQDSAVTTAKINDGAVTTAKIADGGVVEGKINNGAVTQNKLASSVYESTPTSGSSKLITSGGVYSFVNGNFRKYQSITSNDIDTATDQQILYSVYYEGVFCIMYCVSGTSNRIQYLHKSTGEMLYRYQHKSDDIWGDWDDWKYVASQNTFRKTTRPTTSTAGKLWDVRWFIDGTSREHCYQLTSIGGTPESPVYNWTELVTSTSLDNQIVTFSYTLTSSGWNSNNEQTITKPSSYVVTSDVMADTEIGEVAYNQLCADGCGGIYISSERSGSNLTLTAHALNHKPTANVTIQVTLTKVNDISE